MFALSSATDHFNTLSHIVTFSRQIFYKQKCFIDTGKTVMYQINVQPNCAQIYPPLVLMHCLLLKHMLFPVHSSISEIRYWSVKARMRGTERLNGLLSRVEWYIFNGSVVTDGPVAQTSGHGLWPHLY